jgi:hypothetical protein
MKWWALFVLLNSAAARPGFAWYFGRDALWRAVTDTAPALTRAQLLAATRTPQDGGEWSVGPLRLRSFPVIGEEKYSTYLKVVKF